MKRIRVEPVIGIYFFAVLLTIVLTPPFQAPDEPTHLANCMGFFQRASNKEEVEASILAKFEKYRFWQLVNLTSPDPLPTRFYDAPLLRIRPTQASKPKLYFAISAFLLKITGIDRPVKAIYFLRCLNLIYGLIVAWLLLCIARAIKLSGDITTVALCFLLVPQYVYMTASVNPAILAWIAGALFILGAIDLIQYEKKWRSCALLGLATILAAVSHRSAFAVLPAPALAFVVVIYRNISMRNSYVISKKIPIRALGIGSLMVVLWVIAGYLAPTEFRTVLIHSIRNIRALQIHPVPQAGQLSWWWEFSVHFNRSIWLAFGWLKIFAHPLLYGIYAAIALGAIPGIVSSFAGPRKNDLSRPVMIVLLLTTVSILFAAAVQFALQGNYSQGRYIYPAWPAVAVLIAFGWMRWIPAKYHRIASHWALSLTWLILISAIFRYGFVAFYLN